MGFYTISNEFTTNVNDTWPISFGQIVSNWNCTHVDNFPPLQKPDKAARWFDEFRGAIEPAAAFVSAAATRGILRFALRVANAVQARRHKRKRFVQRLRNCHD